MRDWPLRSEAQKGSAQVCLITDSAFLQLDNCQSKLILTWHLFWKLIPIESKQMVLCFLFLREHDETLVLMVLGPRMWFLLSLKCTWLYFLTICSISFPTWNLKCFLPYFRCCRHTRPCSSLWQALFLSGRLEKKAFCFFFFLTPEITPTKFCYINSSPQTHSRLCGISVSLSMHCLNEGKK